MSHAPTPWALIKGTIDLSQTNRKDYSVFECYMIESSDADTLAFVVTDTGQEDGNIAGKATASHIVCCVNEHDGLLNLLKNAANRLRNQGGDIKPITEQLNWSVVQQIEATLERIKSGQTSP
jgi:hypothetical protein